jgi:hypothetical protein
VLTTFPFPSFSSPSTIYKSFAGPPFIYIEYTTIDGDNYYNNNHGNDTPQHPTTSFRTTSTTNINSSTITLEPETKKIILSTYHHSFF